MYVRFAALVALVIGSILLTGCGPGSDDAALSVPAETSTAALPIPTAAQLDAQFRRVIDPRLPDSARTVLVQDGDAFRVALPDLYRALHDNPDARYGIVDPVFDNHDGTITATMRLDPDGTGTSMHSLPVHFLALDRHWELSRVDLCGILVSANYRTPACD